MPTTQRVLHTDSDNHKVVLHSEIVNKRLIRQFVTYNRYPDIKYEYLTSFHAACLILLGVELERCYIPEIRVRMFEKAHAALRDRNRRLRIMRYLRTRHPKLFQQFALEHCQRVGAVADAFNPEGRVEIEIAGEKQTHEGPVLNRPIICRSCLIKKIVFVSAYIAELNLGFTKGYTPYKPNIIFEELSIRNAVFGMAFDLRKVLCQGQVYFREKVAFKSMVHCMYAEFYGEVIFEECFFQNGADFGKATFHKNFRIYDCEFSCSTYFRNSNFKKDGWFLRPIFRKVDFAHAHFGKRCHITNISAEEIDFYATMFCKTLFLSPSTKNSGRAIRSINFQDTTVEGKLACDFRYLEPRQGKPVIKPHRIALGIDEPPYKGKKRQDHWEEAQKQYAWLKEQYRKQGRYGDEDEAHWWAMECWRMQQSAFAFARLVRGWRERAEGGGWPATPTRWTIILSILVLILMGVKLIPTLWNGWQIACNQLSLIAPLLLSAFVAYCLLFPRYGYWKVFRDILGYGVVRWRIIGAAVLVIVIFGALFVIADYTNCLVTKSTSPFESEWLRGFYFSVITFATVGYGDVSATGWAAGLAMVEGLLGVVLNAALIVVIFRKLIR